MHYVRGTIGAFVGAAIGILVYWFLLRNNVQAPILVPGVTGVVAGLAGAKRDVKMGLITAVIAIPATILPDAIWLPFTMDESIGYFLPHLHKLNPIRIGPISLPMLLVYAIGIGLAFWFGMGRDYLRPAGGENTSAATAGSEEDDQSEGTAE